MPVDAKYIEHQALDFANVPLIDRRIIASVHLENQEDELFWDTLLQNVKSGKYNYIYESRVAKDSNFVSGVNQCLHYKSYLSKNFFICIDSDLRYLEQEPGIDANHFILQTYTYSWENHYCIPEVIQSHLTTLSPQAASNFDFVQFVYDLSGCAYEPLLYMLEALDKQLAQKNIVGLFWSCFPKQCTASVFENNGKQLILQITESLQQFVNNDAFVSIDLDAAKEKYYRLGLTENNTCLHLRGHNIWSLLNHIGNMLCRPLQINFTKQVLLPSLQLSGYWEIEKIQQDIHHIIN